ncbi:MAG: type II toxin-antitoxin system VapC family toxin [Terrimicrobiaceae bacterium]
MAIILDTSFVIAVEREAKRREPDKADAFLEAHSGETMFITFTVAGELACGASASAHTQWRRLCQPYAVLPWSMEISWEYGEIYRQLSAAGTLIGTNDLWIAATARFHGMPLVTANHVEFSRVAGLEILAF